MMTEGKIILCPNPSRDVDLSATRTAEKILREAGLKPVLCSPFRDPKPFRGKGSELKPLQRELEGAEAIVTFGGDGTILHLSRLAAMNEIPLLGVNMGGLGFIAELETSELELLRRLKTRDYRIEERMMLDVTVRRGERIIYNNLGLNDAVIREGPISHVIHLKISSDGNHLATVSGDGVIIATPTGSTAYSLSAGGPVMEPTAECIEVCPICVHTMRFSSYVLSPEHVLTVELERNGRKPVFLFVDESRAFDLRSEDVVRVARSEKTLKLIRLSDRNFCEIFSRKMFPGGQTM